MVGLSLECRAACVLVGWSFMGARFLGRGEGNGGGDIVGRVIRFGGVVGHQLFGASIG